MKKTILIALAVLLAIMAVTCDSFAPDADYKEPARGSYVRDVVATRCTGLAGYTEDGRPLYGLEFYIPKNNSRALTSNLAKNNVTYYEVAFKDPDFATTGKIYRTAWDYTQTGRIAVPAGDYDAANKAVLFAGRQEDKTLLAVGVITHVDTVLGTVIKPTTANVTFTLAPLTNDISFNPKADTGITASTFQILTPTAYATSEFANAAAFPKVTLEADHRTYPVYQVPNGSTAITATYTINCGTAGANFAGVIIPPPTAPATVYQLISGPVTNLTSGLKVTGTVLPNGSATIPTAGVAVPTSGIFNITINTTGVADGLSKISIEVPVRPIDITADFPGTWYIRGGLNQSALDEGISANTIGSLGGAVLLGVGSYKEKSITIITTQP